jgi:hypothetical protein
MAALVIAAQALASAANAAGPIVSSTLTGSTGTAVVGGTLYARSGSALSLTVVTDASTYCVALSGTHTAMSDVSTSPDESTKMWSFSLTSVGGSDGARSTTVTASYNSACATANGTTSVSYTVDNTSPTTIASPTTGGGGSTVTVSLSGTDNLSGLKSTNFRLDGGPTSTYDSANPPTFSAQGSHSLEYWSVDNVGNTESHHTFSSSADGTPPNVSVSQSPPANGNGWNNSNVTVTFTCTDAGSGVASCPVPVVVSVEGASQTVSGTAFDNAGNSASASTTVSVDKTVPAVSVSGVTQGGSYPQGGYSASCSTSDALSGVATKATLSTTGGPTGPVTLTCSGATDRAGNAQASPVSVQITVTGNTDGGGFRFGGFRPPVAGNGAVNRVRPGMIIPVRFTLGGYQGMHVLAAGYPASAYSQCSGTPDPSTLQRANWPWAAVLRYDRPTETYGFLWFTSPRWTGCRTLVLKFSDGSTALAYFDFERHHRHVRHRHASA